MVSIRRNLAASAAPIEQLDPPLPPRETLPTMYDLPSEDPEEPGLPDEFHDLQPQLLSRTLRLKHYSRENCFTVSDLNLYYDLRHPLWHKRPDWFLAVDVSRLYEQRDLRRSYVVWQEPRPPHVVVEFLSPGTEAEDLGRFYSVSSRSLSQEVELIEAAKEPPGKFAVYESHLRVPHYIVYSRFTQQLRYFKLTGGQYEEQALNSANPLVWLTDLEIGLGIWQGEFEDVTAAWLRWCDSAGNWMLTDTEQAEQQAEQAEQQAEQAHQAAEQAEARLLQAACNLLATGMTVEAVAQMLGLSLAEVAALQAAD